MSKQYKLKAIELAEQAIDELDKLDLDKKRALVSWIAMFWDNVSQDLAGYTMARPDIKELSLKGLRNKFQKVKELI